MEDGKEEAARVVEPESEEEAPEKEPGGAEKTNEGGTSLLNFEEIFSLEILQERSNEQAEDMVAETAAPAPPDRAGSSSGPDDASAAESGREHENRDLPATVQGDFPLLSASFGGSPIRAGDADEETESPSGHASADQTRQASKTRQASETTQPPEAPEAGDLFLEYLRLKNSAEKLNKELAAVAARLDHLFGGLEGDTLGTTIGTTIGTIRRVRDGAGRSGWVIVTGD